MVTLHAGTRFGPSPSKQQGTIVHLPGVRGKLVKRANKTGTGRRESQPIGNYCVARQASSARAFLQESEEGKKKKNDEGIVNLNKGKFPNPPGDPLQACRARTPGKY